LVELLEDEEEGVAEALWEIAEHTEVTPAFVVGLAAKKWEGIRVAEALWRIDKHPASVTALAKAFRKHAVSGDDEVLDYVAGVLGDIGPEAKAAVPVLVEALSDRDRWVRKSAAAVLEKVDPTALDDVGHERGASRDRD
jgi:HEAT repeat protein